jgi:hypothetical protein
MNEWRNANESISLNTPSPKSMNSDQSRNSNNGYKNAFDNYVFKPEVYYESARNDINLLLFYASKFNDTELILSLDKANPNLSKYDPEANREMTPLLYAIAYDNMVVFKFLLKNIDVNMFVDDNPLLHELLEFGNLRYLKELLLQPRLDLTIENNEGDTAIYIAVKYFDNNPREYLKIIKQMIQMDERITHTFNQRNILRLAFNLSDTSECNELLMLLYKYQPLAEGREKAYIEGLKQFKDARHFVTYVSKTPQLSRRTQHEILTYLTAKPKTRFKNMTYNNNAALKVAARTYPFKGVSYNALKPYLCKTKKKLLDNKETKRRAGSRRVRNHKKK